jgi:hypothetical protein
LGYRYAQLLGMDYIKRLFYFLGLFLLVQNVYGQTWELGVGAGGAGYIGDLNQKQPLKISGISAGGYVKMNFDPYWTLGLHYTYGKIKANDAHSDNAQFRDRNLNFRTSLNEVSLQIDFNFFDYFAGGGMKNFTPYIFSGMGATLFNPKATHDGNDYKLRFYETEGQKEPYRNYAFSIPYGAGFKVRLRENWGFFSQIGYRTAYSDFLDDVSGKYPSQSAWPQDDSAEIRVVRQNLADPSLSQYGTPGVQRGDFRKRDTYMFVGIGISYTFVSQKCYTF